METVFTEAMPAKALEIQTPYILTIWRGCRPCCREIELQGWHSAGGSKSVGVLRTRGVQLGTLPTLRNTKDVKVCRSCPLTCFCKS
jgi:hypothetical protein